MFELEIKERRSVGITMARLVFKPSGKFGGLTIGLKAVTKQGELNLSFSVYSRLTMSR
jgi:hypothetical protein